MSACFFFPPLIIFEIPFFMVLLAELGYQVRSAVSVTGQLQAQAKQFQGCSLVFQTKGGVDVGMMQHEDGSISLECDEQQLERVEGISKLELKHSLTQKYTHKKINEELAKHGFSVVEEQTLDDQTIKIRVRRWS
jgi:hypothetical protein